MGKDKIKAHGILLVFLFFFYCFRFDIFLSSWTLFLEVLAGRMVGQKRNWPFQQKRRRVNLLLLMMIPPMARGYICEYKKNIAHDTDGLKLGKGEMGTFGGGPSTAAEERFTSYRKCGIHMRAVLALAEYNDVSIWMWQCDLSLIMKKYSWYFCHISSWVLWVWTCHSCEAPRSSMMHLFICRTHL